jgi:purine-nucleoside phosphorylase
MTSSITPSEQLERALGSVRERIPSPPQVALVLGSGLGEFADTLTEASVVSFAEVEGMVPSAVEGHAGNLVFGARAGVQLAVMQGRLHLYEGHAAERVVFGVRLMVALGAQVAVLTNAAGGIREGLAPGDLMLIEDQINLTGHNPLRGPNDSALGTRFPDMSSTYDATLRDLALRTAQDAGIALQRGVYAGVLGPSYETPAEVRMLRILGADAVGMSTVLEAIAARHMGARCVGLSCITNLAAGSSDATLDHRDVQQRAAAARPRVAALLDRLLPALARERA